MIALGSFGLLGWVVCGCGCGAVRVGRRETVLLRARRSRIVRFGTEVISRTDGCWV